jgi:glyoxylase-like metal-dependent hydrolase (beta-lactamase superfamily II)
VFLAPNVRGGFHHLFVEFSDFVLVVDATAPWLELHEIPASGERSPEAMDDLGERLIRMIRSRIPSKPIRYVALTHHHDDHAGGVKAFVDSGATVVATDITRQVVDRVAPGAQVQLVRGSMTIADSTMDVQLIDVGDNPHAEGMLIAWLPRQRLLYTSDLWEPQSERFFPSAARVPVMRWFARWIESSGLQPELIYAIHGSARVTPEQLALIRSLPE